MFCLGICFILKIGQILLAFSLCDFLSGTICSVQLDKVAHGKNVTDAETIAAECEAVAALCTAGGVDSQIGLHGRRMVTGSAPRLFAALLHPVCFSYYTRSAHLVGQTVLHYTLKHFAQLQHCTSLMANLHLTNWC